MLKEKLVPMDIYSSRMDIPFDAAAYCRGHKLSIEAVNYAKAIRKAHLAEEAVVAAQRLSDEAQADMAVALRDLREKMERDPA